MAPLGTGVGVQADLQYLLDSTQPALEACKVQVDLVLSASVRAPQEDDLVAWRIHAIQMLITAEGWRQDGFPEPRHAFLLLAEILDHGRRGLTLLSLAAQRAPPHMPTQSDG